VHVPGLLSAAECVSVSRRIAHGSSGAVGSRVLLSQPWCRTLARQVRAHPAVSALLPASYVATQCTYFEKSLERNWLVPWHQDLSIPVAGRVDDPELRGWSEKEGSLHVQAPVAVLERLVAVRVHIDACGAADGPLRVVPGSHLQGPIDAPSAARVAGIEQPLACIAEAGGAWVMRPLLLHASSKSTGSSLRRVLHFLFGPPTLPLGLRWRHEVRQGRAKSRKSKRGGPPCSAPSS
jgi:ectoine hydroxylase-related dioxygenase (phytanoyl-CoA dioxygenase family)